MSGGEIQGWADRIEAVLPQGPIEQVFVYQETGSTQDAAWRHRDPARGVMAVASVQTQGRGQRGSRWHDGVACTLPVSFAVPVSIIGHQPGPAIASRAGLAALDTVAGALPDPDAVGIKWPNDIEARSGGKLAGVLVERRDDTVIIGVGINVLTSERGEAPFAGAKTIQCLGGRTDRCELACVLASKLAYWVGQDDDAVRARWRTADTLVGTRRVVQLGSQHFEGVVEAIDPLGAMIIETAGGTRSFPVDQIRLIVID